MKIKMRILFPVILILISSASMAQHSIRILELHGESLGNLKIDYAGKTTAVGNFGAGANVTVGKEHFGVVLAYNYNRIDLRNLGLPGVNNTSTSEFYLGARYYPMRPTFIIGKAALRITAGGAYGFDMEPNWRGILFGGVALSPVTSCSGISLNFVYRPGTFPVGGYLTSPSYSLRFGIIIGPSLK